MESGHSDHLDGSDTSTASFTRDIKSNPFSYVNKKARIAIYDDLVSAPRIIDIEPAPIMEFIESIATSTYEFAQKLGGDLPYTVIREIAENFIHASFAECTVSILDQGNTICFSDQGPGIEKKHLVQKPGITSATSEMKYFIRGVGSGFPLVKEYLGIKNGYLSIDDNALKGTVITLSIQSDAMISQPPTQVPQGLRDTEGSRGSNDFVEIDKRGLLVLHLFNEKGILGPSDITGPLGVSVATAYRILVDLEKKGLIETAPHRKRILSSAGVAFLEANDSR